MSNFDSAQNAYDTALKGIAVAEAQEYILKSGDYYLAYLFAKNIPGNALSRFQRLIVNSGDARLMYLFACNVPGVVIEDLQNGVASSGNPAKIYQFARDIPGADTLKLQQALADLGDPWWAYQFAREGLANQEGVESLQKAVLKSICADYLYLFARDVEGADIDRLQKRFIENGASTDAMVLFAQKVPGANVREIIESISKNPPVRPWWAYRIAVHSGSEVNLLQKIVVDSGDVEVIYLFARDVEGADIPTLQEAILSASPENPDKAYWAVEFAVEIAPSNIEKLQPIVLDSKDPSTMCRFVFNFYGKVDVDVFLKAILDSENEYYIDMFLNWKARKLRT